MLLLSARDAARHAGFAFECKSACLSNSERNLPGFVRGLKQTLTEMASTMRQPRKR